MRELPNPPPGIALLGNLLEARRDPLGFLLRLTRRNATHITARPSALLLLRRRQAT